MGSQEKVDLFLYTTGGITIAGYGLVNLIREFCNKFGVLIPFKAHSAGTLIALGADEVVMTKMGQLSPIDPSIVSPYGPQMQIPGQLGAAQALPVNVEDAMSYLGLARDELKLKDEDSLVRVFDRLSQAVNPLALGAVSRSREEISFLASTLLKYHIKDPEKIKGIVDLITRGRYSHSYLIGRREASEVLGLNLIDNEEVIGKIVELYYEYDRMLELNNPYSAEAVLGAKDTVESSSIRAVIESDDLTHIFRTVRKIERVTVPQGPGGMPAPAILERVIEEKWSEDNKI